TPRSSSALPVSQQQSAAAAEELVETACAYLALPGAHSRSGLKDAIITAGGLDRLVRLLLDSDSRTVRSAASVVLGYLTFNRTAARLLLKACRENPGLFYKLEAALPLPDARICDEFLADFRLPRKSACPASLSQHPSLARPATRSMEVNGGHPILPSRAATAKARARPPTSVGQAAGPSSSTASAAQQQKMLRRIPTDFLNVLIHHLNDAKERAAASADEIENPQQEGIRVLDFAAARAAELQHLESQLGLVSSGFVHGLQRLPRRMRRRAASHNPRRLPLRLRRSTFNEAQALMAKQKLRRQQKKRLKRLFRRRNRTRLGKERPDWLATHLWHAKRFSYGDQMGLPPRRAAHRQSSPTVSSRSRPWRSASRRLLPAPLPALRPRIQPGQYPGSPIRPDEAARLRSRLLSDRQFSMNLTVHRVDSYPLNCLGPVRLDGLATGTCWLWCHPLFSSQLTVELETAVRSDGESESSANRVAVDWQRDQFCCYRLFGPAVEDIMDKFLTQPPDGLSAEAQSHWNRWLNRRSQSSDTLHSVQLLCPPCQISSSAAYLAHIPTLPATSRPLKPAASLPAPAEAAVLSSASWTFVTPAQGLRRPPLAVGGLRELALAEAELESQSAWSFPAGFPDSVAAPAPLGDGLDHLVRDRGCCRSWTRLVRARLPAGSPRFTSHHALMLRPESVNVRSSNPDQTDRSRTAESWRRTAGVVSGWRRQLGPSGTVLDGRQSNRTGQATGEAVVSLISLIESANQGGRGFELRLVRVQKSAVVCGAKVPIGSAG
uniref:POP1 domain-containing protein n=1 Tax=Macrostomum lignano TaxID=282301 RepID=A0A1I8FP40_9PLAT